MKSSQCPLPRPRPCCSRWVRPYGGGRPAPDPWRAPVWLTDRLPVASMHLPLLQISDSIQGMANSIWAVRERRRAHRGGSGASALRPGRRAPGERTPHVGVCPSPAAPAADPVVGGPAVAVGPVRAAGQHPDAADLAGGRAAAPALHWQPPSACISRGALREPPCCADAWASPPDPCRSSP